MSWISLPLVIYLDFLHAPIPAFSVEHPLLKRILTLKMINIVNIDKSNSKMAIDDAKICEVEGQVCCRESCSRSGFTSHPGSCCNLIVVCEAVFLEMFLVLRAGGIVLERMRQFNRFGEKQRINIGLMILPSGHLMINVIYLLRLTRYT